MRKLSTFGTTFALLLALSIAAISHSPGLLAQDGTLPPSDTVPSDAATLPAADTPGDLPAAFNLELEVLGTYDSGIFDGSAAEIVAYDPDSERAFTTNAEANAIDVLDLNQAENPVLEASIELNDYGAGINSVAVYDGVVAAAVAAEAVDENGVVVFFDADSLEFISQVEAGALPDMLIFTPDGSKLLVANEGEPSDDYAVDPEGSVTVVDLSGGVENVSDAAVSQLTFEAFNGAALDPSIRIFGPGATVAQDLEPEYIAVSPDSTRAWVVAQENNAFGMIDLTANDGAGEIVELVGLGFKDWNQPAGAALETFEFSELPVLGTTEAGQEILLGGFSGLYFEGVDEISGNLRFIAHPDRGPNAEPVDVDGDGVDERPFPLPDYQAQVVRFELDPERGTLEITEQIGLVRETENGEVLPITGLPNLAGEAGMAYADEEPVDLLGNSLELDPYGADLEGIVVAEDGTFWMVDEYRPAIYHFDEGGLLIDRFVPASPEGDDEEATDEEAVDVGTPSLPAVFAQRRPNRGFEAVAYREPYLYAFIQSPLDNPDTEGDTNSRASHTVRILEFDTRSGETVGQYLYRLDGEVNGSSVDKIGDAVMLNNREMLVIERDDATGPDAQKFIYRIDLADATNIHNRENQYPIGPNQGLELQSELGLARVGITPVEKTPHVDLIALGYERADKPEGLALIDENTLAVINDNDFGLLGTFDVNTGTLDDNPSAVPTLLGLISTRPNGFDASNEDGYPNVQPWPVFGMYQPDSIAAYDVDGAVYIASANEGDARDYDGFSEEVRVADLVLDLGVYPDAVELQQPDALGRLVTTVANGDANGDGLTEQIYSFGARSFSIWDADGNLVWDSGSELAEIVLDNEYSNFNSNGVVDSADERSDDKGVEPEALDVGTIDDRTFAFIGLERQSAIVVYDISVPTAPHFVTYVFNRDAGLPAEEAGDIAPEGIQFVSATDSPTGSPLLIVANEVSGTTTVWSIETVAME